VARWCGTASGVPWVPTGPAAARLRRALADRPYVTVRDRHSAAGWPTPAWSGRSSGARLGPAHRPDHARRLAGRAARPPAAARLPAGGSSAAGCRGCDCSGPTSTPWWRGWARWRATRPVRPRSWSSRRDAGRGDGPAADDLAAGLRPAGGGRRRARHLGGRSGASGRCGGGGPRRRRVAGADVFVGTSLHGASPPSSTAGLLLLNLIDGPPSVTRFVDVTGLQHLVVHAAGDVAAPRPRRGRAGRAGAAARAPGPYRPALRPDRRPGPGPGRGPTGGPARPSLDSYAVLDQLARLLGEADTVRAALARAGGEADTVRAALGGPGRTGRADRRAGEAERELSASRPR